VTTDSDLRYTFACPSCAASFSITLAKIPPVQARFSCPKCAKAMDFPSREEARVYVMLQSGQGEATAAEDTASMAPPSSNPAPLPPSVAEAKPAAPEAEKRYTVDKKGFENDSYDRRAMLNLIRSGGITEFDLVRCGETEAVRAADLPGLKSLFELRKTSRTTPPTVCRKHTDVLAHYVCGDTGRPLCEECAPEKKFGGASVRVCDHCGGTVGDLPMKP
jgi:predicted Zn finger-like uncharacterized protein